MSTTRTFFDPVGAFAAEDTATRAAAAKPPTLSYRALLGEAWWDLPAATRDRFEHHDALYTGTMKALDVDGALVERLGFGLRMRLVLHVRDGALCFDSAGYYVDCPGLAWRGRRHCAYRIPLPAWFLPGRTGVAHHDLGGGRFRFTMTIRHWLLGDLFRHDGVFRSVE